jgi:hypothetical protein
MYYVSVYVFFDFSVYIYISRNTSDLCFINGGSQRIYASPLPINYRLSLTP